MHGALKLSWAVTWTRRLKRSWNASSCARWTMQTASLEPGIFTMESDEDEEEDEGFTSSISDAVFETAAKIENPFERSRREILSYNPFEKKSDEASKHYEEGKQMEKPSEQSRVCRQCFGVSRQKYPSLIAYDLL